MNKYYLLIVAMLSFSMLVSAGPKQKKADTWVDVSIKAKTEFQAQLKKGTDPEVEIITKELQEGFPDEMALLEAVANGLDNWLTTPDASVE